MKPVCAFHNKRTSEHTCLYCCLCFKTLTPGQCATDSTGAKIDVCKTCYAEEARICEERGIPHP